MNLLNGLNTLGAVSARGEAFHPTDILVSSLVAGFDVTDAANYTESGGTITSLTNLGQKSGTPATFTLTAAPTISTGVAVLNGQDALLFNASDNVTIPDGTYLDYTKFTVAGVFSVDSDEAGTRGLTGKWGPFAGGAGEYSVQISNGNVFQFLCTPNGTSASAVTCNSTVTHAVNTPYLFLAWLDGTNMNLYVGGNGAEETVQQAFTTTTGFAQALEVGRTFTGNAFTGKMPEYYNWTAQLDAAQIAAMKDYFISKYNIDVTP